MKALYTPLLLTLFLGPLAIAQEPAMWQLTDEQGLPSLTVYQILQDQRGYIWMGTQNGVCRYDGRSFRYWKPEPLIDQEIVYLQEDRWGRIWFNNLSGQTGWIEAGKAKLLEHPELDSRQLPKRFELAEDGIFLFASSNGELKLNKMHFDASGKKTSLTSYGGTQELGMVSQLFYRGDTAIFKELSYDEEKQLCRFVVGVGDSLQRLEKKVAGPFAKHPNLLDIQGSFSDGNILLTDKANAFLKRGQQAVQVTQFEQKTINNGVLIEGRIWISTNAGLFVYDLESLHLQYHLLDGIKVNCVFLDRENNYWVGTTNRGIYVLPNLQFQLYRADQGLSGHSDVNSLWLSDLSSQILAGTSDGQLVRIDYQTGESSKFSLPASGRIMSVVKDQAGGIWVGCDVGLYHIPPDEMGQSDLPRLLSQKSIKELMVDQRNRLWAGTANSVELLEKLDQGNGSAAKTLLQERTYGLCQDEQGSVWMGTTEGIFLYRNGHVRKLELAAGPTAFRVAELRRDKRGNIWAATSGDGLLKIKQGQLVKQFSIADGLPSNNCTALSFAGDRVLIGTDNGLVIWDTERHRMDILDKEKGLPSNEVNCLASNEDMAWVGTPKGMLQFPWTALKRNTVPPPVYIADFIVNGNPTAREESIRLDYQENTIDIAFVGLAFSAKGKETYRYRLKGLEENWNTTVRRTARFHTLAPGRYVFEVRAVNEDGTASKAPAKLSFRVAAPWWRTNWFAILALAALMSATAGTVYWRLSDLRKREAVERDLRERIHFLSVEALRAQMNPHFIYNALNAIQDFFLQKDQRSAIFYLSKFAQLIRLIFDFSRQSAITLAEELHFLELYLELEQLRFEDRVEIHFRVDPALREKAEAFELPPLLVQPVIENSFKHGLMHRLEGGQLWISFEETEQGQLHITVQDNGVGRAKAAELNHWQNHGKRSGGLQNTRERLKIFHSVGEDSQLSYLKVTDLKDTQGNPNGTKTEITINYKSC